MICDMCGSEVDILAPTMVEGTELNICSKCSKYGIRLKKPMVRAKPLRFSKPKTKEEPEEIELIRNDYANLIRDKRSDMGLTQKELAKMLAEKEAIISKMESGSFEPSIPLARKIEKMMGLSLVETEKLAPGSPKTESESGEFTLGDFVKVRKR